MEPKMDRVCHRQVFALVLVCLFCTATFCTCAEEPGEPSSPVVVPFTLTKANNIAVAAQINETDKVQLMLHTAISGVAITSAAAEKATSIDWDKAGNMVSWGGTSKTRYSTSNRLQMGPLSWDEQSFVEDVLSGHETDGKFGLDMFAGKIIGVDFDQSQLTIYTALPEIATAYERMKIEMRDGSLFVEAAVRIGTTKHQNKFLIHSGFVGTILFDDAFVTKNVPPDSLRQIGQRTLRDSLGNVLTTKTVVLPGLKLGHTKFADVPIGLFSGKIGNQQMSVIGGELLKRFNWLVDVENSRLYLKPNGLFAEEFPVPENQQPPNSSEANEIQKSNHAK
jgi:hypothetical protein